MQLILKIRHPFALLMHAKAKLLNFPAQKVFQLVQSVSLSPLSELLMWAATANSSCAPLGILLGKPNAAYYGYQRLTSWNPKILNTERQSRPRKQAHQAKFCEKSISSPSGRSYVGPESTQNIVMCHPCQTHKHRHTNKDTHNKDADRLDKPRSLRTSPCPRQGSRQAVTVTYDLLRDRL